MKYRQHSIAPRLIVVQVNDNPSSEDIHIGVAFDEAAAKSLVHYANVGLKNDEYIADRFPAPAPAAFRDEDGDIKSETATDDGGPWPMLPEPPNRLDAFRHQPPNDHGE